MEDTKTNLEHFPIPGSKEMPVGGGVSLSGFLFLFFLGPHPRGIEVPSLGAELELQLPGYTSATAARDASHVCGLYSLLRAMLDP